MNGYRLLSAGVLAIAIVLGYMVAASGTPVAAVAIPAAFGLVVAGIGLLHQTPKSAAVSVGAAPTQAEDKREASASGTPPVHRSAPMRYGVALICFALGFAGGLALGATARLDGWFSPKAQLIQFTWVRYGLAEPPSAEAALYWLYLQGVLQARGFSDDQMKALYLLQAKDWMVRAPVAALFDPQKPATPASPNVSANQTQTSWGFRNPRGLVRPQTQ